MTGAHATQLLATPGMMHKAVVAVLSHSLCGTRKGAKILRSSNDPQAHHLQVLIVETKCLRLGMWAAAGARNLARGRTEAEIGAKGDFLHRAAYEEPPKALAKAGARA